MTLQNFYRPYIKTETRDYFSNHQYENNNNNNGVDIYNIPTWPEFFNSYYDDYIKGFVKLRSSTDELKGPKPVEYLNQKVSIWVGNIVNLEMNAIVNSTNILFDGDCGLDKTVQMTGGIDMRTKMLMEPIGKMGEVCVTKGYLLPANLVFHAICPQTEDTEILLACYANSLNCMIENGCKTIAFPCIATGCKGYKSNPEGAAEIAVKTVRLFLEKQWTKVDRVVFCLQESTNVPIYVKLMHKYFPLTTMIHHTP